jgi:hypothetical protein
MDEVHCGTSSSIRGVVAAVVSLAENMYGEYIF